MIKDGRGADGHDSGNKADSNERAHGGSPILVAF
jgi:hypothetical protein